MVDRTQQAGGGERVVDQQRDRADLGRNRGQIEDIDQRVPETFNEAEFRLRRARGGDRARLVRIHKGQPDAVGLREMIEQLGRATIQPASRNNVVTLLRERQQRCREDAHARCGDEAGFGPFELRDICGKGFMIRVAVPRIDVACGVPAGDRVEVLQVFQVKRGRHVNGRGARFGLELRCATSSSGNCRCIRLRG